MAKQFENQISELQHKCDESNRSVNELNSQKAKLQAENSNIIVQLEDLEHQCSALSKERNCLQSALEEARSALEEETRVCITLSMHTYNSYLCSLICDSYKKIKANCFLYSNFICLTFVSGK
jgi:chromosome segregation ATPase